MTTQGPSKSSSRISDELHNVSMKFSKNTVKLVASFYCPVEIAVALIITRTVSPMYCFKAAVVASV